MIVSKLLTSLPSSRINFWHKKEKHFTRIEISWFRFISKNLLSFLTFNYTTNKNTETFHDSDTTDMIQIDL